MIPREKKANFTTHSPGSCPVSFETQRTQRNADVRRYFLVNAFLCALCVSSEAGGENKVFTALSNSASERPPVL